MDLTTIIAVALSTVILIIIIGLAAAFIYYRWRTTELMAGLAQFIRKTEKQRDELERLETEIQKLKEQEYN